MNKPAKITALVASVALWAFASAAKAAPDVNKVLDGFIGAVESNPSIAAEQKRQVRLLVKELRQTPEDRGAAITESLRLIYPEFKEALAALGDDNLGAAVVGLEKLNRSADPYLAAAAGDSFSNSVARTQP